MLLAQATDDGRWGLLGKRPGQAALIAGGLSVWATRITNGEGPWALPLTGQWAPPAPPREFDFDQMFRGLVWSPEARLGPEGGIAAVIGASLEGRRNPFRSVLGYIAVSRGSRDGPSSWGPVLVTREDLGDDPPILLPHDGSEPIDAIARLRAADEGRGLCAGDVVVLGAARLSGDGWSRLRPGGGPQAIRRTDFETLTVGLPGR